MPVTSLLKNEMVYQGWCPCMIYQLSESARMIMYARDHDPYIRMGSKSHKDCSGRGCTISILDSDSYEAKHVESSCRCKNLVLPDVENTLMSGEIPVIQHCQQSDSPVCLDSTSTTFQYLMFGRMVLIAQLKAAYPFAKFKGSRPLQKDWFPMEPFE